MPIPPTAPAPAAQGVQIYSTEGGVVAVAQRGSVAVLLRGAATEADGEAELLAMLDALAKRRGVQPRLVADRTLEGLLAALGS